MMRVKIILPNFIAVLVLGLVSYFYLKTSLRNQTKNELKEQLGVVSALFARSEGLRGFDLLNNVRAQAMSRNMVSAFEKVEIEAAEGHTPQQMNAIVHEVWFKKCVKAIKTYTKMWQQQHGKRPELVLLTDRKGVALARNTTPNACPVTKNVADGMPVVTRALDGEATYAVWSNDDSPFSKTKKNPQYCQLMNTDLLEVAAAPIWVGDSIAGALVVGFDISNGTAMKHAELTHMDVAVLKGGDVYSSSFGTDTARRSLEEQIASAKTRSRIDSAIQKGQLSGSFDISVEGKPYLARVIPVANAEIKDRVATMLMAPLDRSAMELRSLRIILVVMVVVLLAVFGAGILLSNHFLKPVMEMEEGILKVINGEFQYRFDVKSSEVGGLSYRINQMIGVLTGEDDDTTDENDGQR